MTVLSFPRAHPQGAVTVLAPELLEFIGSIERVAGRRMWVGHLDNIVGLYDKGGVTAYARERGLPLLHHHANYLHIICTPTCTLHIKKMRAFYLR